jgi:WhiB family redox-sensing transcriptional regulator
MQYAACAGLGKEGDIFFPERNTYNVDAVRLCGGCEVRPQCKEWRKRSNSQYGIWGGVLQTRDKNKRGSE